MFSVSSTFLGMSARSFSLSFGRMMFLMPARCAARTFSFTPPIGSTLPRSVISPVIATSRRVGILVSADTSVVASEMRVVGEDDFVRRPPRPFHRLRREEALGDLDLFRLGVPGELEHFHAVAERLR